MKPCNACGKCCEMAGDGGLSASADDINRWEIHRPDLLPYVEGSRIWIDPESGQYFSRCPWLRQSPASEKTYCDIYEDRPDDCRYFPVDVAQMIAVDCEMIERRDLLDLKRAQRELDDIMMDSRPPAGR